MISSFFSRLRPATLQQKTTIFLLLPTFAILAVMGLIGNEMVRRALLEQWQQTAITKLQRSAHHIDMRLMRPRELLTFLQRDTDNSAVDSKFQLILDQLRRQEGVVQVKVERDEHPDTANAPAARQDHGADAHSAAVGQRLWITPPVFNSEFGRDTVSLITSFKDGKGLNRGRIEVVISFYDLIDQVVKAPWWQGNQAILVDDDGNVLLRTPGPENSSPSADGQQFGSRDALEHETRAAMQNTAYGTVFSGGAIPDRISSFYRLSEAPWTMVVISRGEKALQPILELRKYSFLVTGLGILAALFYIRLVIGTITRSVKNVSEAADRLARGRFSTPLKIESRDEVGELTRSFNIMATHLEERMRLQQEMSIAREVQQNLLPQASFSTEGLEIAGISNYCQHTGGDYFDLLPSASRPGVATVIVGDVVGHGIGAALMMASLRSMLRCRSSLPGTPVEIINDVNRLLCRDTRRSGNFSTLFYLTVDRPNRRLDWIRCGHDPAILYCIDSGRFSELRGEGVVLGVDDGWRYREHSYTFYGKRQILLIGSDGIWEAENDAGERFGKQRLKEIIARCCDLPAEKLVSQVVEQLREFQNGHPQHDDITMTVVKTW